MGLPTTFGWTTTAFEVPLEESLYRARGYLPLVEHLPWQEDYSSKKLSMDRTESAEKAARDQARQDFRARFRGT
jgi:hypothetical protein